MTNRVRRSMGETARARIETELAWQHQRDNYLEVYDRLLGGPRSALAIGAVCQRPPPARQMCGVAGCYQQADGASLARVMSDRIAHRGPDAHGLHCFVDDRVSVHLAHRRLSIIDLSEASDQPFCKDGLSLSYNGELYNYREIRTELVSHGVRFETSSDTEVVLEAWRLLGPTRPSPVPRDVRLRSARRTQRAAVPRARPAWASSLSTTCGAKAASCSRRSSRRWWLRSGASFEIEPSALVASMLYYWVPDQRCSIAGRGKAPAGIVGSNACPTARSGWSATGAWRASPPRPPSGPGGGPWPM